MSLGIGEILIILIIAYVIVGPKDMSKLARKIAKGLRDIRRLGADVKEDLDLGGELAALRSDLPRSKSVGAGSEIGRIRSEIRRQYGSVDERIKSSIKSSETADALQTVAAEAENIGNELRSAQQGIK